MQFLSFTPPDDGRNEATRRDVSTIDAALADARRRPMAEAALALVADLLAHEPERQPEPLSGADRATLARLGITAEVAMPDADFYGSEPVRAGLAQRARMIVGAMPLADAARRIGVSDGRLRQRIANGTLVAIARPRGRGWLIPAFQLTETGDLPHLGRVLSARQRRVAPEALARAFETPDDGLGQRSPRDWLIAGGDPAPVERIVAGL